jgi:AraC-like DNA-binding protein
VTLFLNLGENIQSKHFENIRNESIFLVGTMLRWDEQVLQGESKLLGIQFRPGAFTHFYRYESMDKMANQLQEFSRSMFPDVKKTIRFFVPYLDQFYLDRLSPPKYSLMSIVAEIEHLGGQIKIETLAKRHFTTERQLERQFNQQIGVSPKEFLNLTRFKTVLAKIQQNQFQKSLSEIAWDCGYYDHAHLSNDFKRYTGTAPSGLILSDFSKSLVS